MGAWLSSVSRECDSGSWGCLSPTSWVEIALNKTKEKLTRPFCVMRDVRKEQQGDSGKDEWVACFGGLMSHFSLPLRDEYFRMKLQWKSVSPEQERRNSLLHGYRSLIGRLKGQGWGGDMANSREGTGEAPASPGIGMTSSAAG